jgi:hypothetical protein
MKKNSELRHTKERSEASQQLVQNLQSGLQHIAEALGIAFREEESPVVDLVHDIDAVLETLMEEREKQQQQQQQQLHGHSQSASESASRVHTSNARDNAAVRIVDFYVRILRFTALCAEYGKYACAALSRARKRFG